MVTPEHHWLRDFVKESNRIEGIYRPPTWQELDASAVFVALPKISVDAVCCFVTICQPGAVIRNKEGLDVRVGDYVAPVGSPCIKPLLAQLLRTINEGRISPFDAHLKYEALHPFTDGNGRSGRIIWAWQMRNNGAEINLPFLHRFYYQTLEHTDAFQD